MTEFHGTIEGGKLAFRPSVALAWTKYRGSHEGARVVISEWKEERNRSQNRYYWLYLEIIARETGDTANDLHEFLKRKLLPPRFLKVRGEELRIPASTRDLDKTDFAAYLDRICALTNVPLPDPEEAGYIHN
jgi:hypothetical protein